MKEHVKIRNLLTLAAAGVLDSSDQRRVEEHLHYCEECRAEFNGWSSLAGALRGLPTPQAPPNLVLQTQRLLRRAVAFKQEPAHRLGPGLALLIVFSWILSFVTVGFYRMLDLPVAQWLDVSSTTLWFAYTGLTWLASALAAGLLGKRWQQEGRTI